MARPHACRNFSCVFVLQLFLTAAATFTQGRKTEISCKPNHAIPDNVFVKFKRTRTQWRLGEPREVSPDSNIALAHMYSGECTWFWYGQIQLVRGTWWCVAVTPSGGMEILCNASVPESRPSSARTQYTPTQSSPEQTGQAPLTKTTFTTASPSTTTIRTPTRTTTKAKTSSAPPLITTERRRAESSRLLTITLSGLAGFGFTVFGIIVFLACKQRRLNFSCQPVRLMVPPVNYPMEEESPPNHDTLPALLQSPSSQRLWPKSFQQDPEESLSSSHESNVSYSNGAEQSTEGPTPRECYNPAQCQVSETALLTLPVAAEAPHEFSNEVISRPVQVHTPESIPDLSPSPHSPDFQQPAEINLPTQCSPVGSLDDIRPSVQQQHQCLCLQMNADVGRDAGASLINGHPHQSSPQSPTSIVLHINNNYYCPPQ